MVQVVEEEAGMRVSFLQISPELEEALVEVAAKVVLTRVLTEVLVDLQGEAEEEIQLQLLEVPVVLAAAGVVDLRAAQLDLVVAMVPLASLVVLALVVEVLDLEVLFFYKMVPILPLKGLRVFPALLRRLDLAAAQMEEQAQQRELTSL
jgi:hypothetical protein